MTIEHWYARYSVCAACICKVHYTERLVTVNDALSLVCTNVIIPELYYHYETVHVNVHVKFTNHCTVKAQSQQSLTYIPVELSTHQFSCQSVAVFQPLPVSQPQQVNKMNVLLSHTCTCTCAHVYTLQP